MLLLDSKIQLFTALFNFIQVISSFQQPLPFFSRSNLPKKILVRNHFVLGLLLISIQRFPSRSPTLTAASWFSKKPWDSAAMAFVFVLSSPNILKDQFEIGHVVAQVLLLQALELLVFQMHHPEGRFRYFGGQNGVFNAFLHSPTLPFIGQLFAELWVLYFLYPLAANLCQPEFEQLGLR